MKALIGTILGVLTTLLVLVRALVVIKVRLRHQYVVSLLKEMRDSRWCFALQDEIGEVTELPRSCRIVGWVGFLCYLTTEERVLHAGYSSVDVLATAYVPRWSFRNLNELVTTADARQDGVPVYLMHDWDAEKVTEMPIWDPSVQLLCDRDLWDSVEAEITLRLREKRRLGILLHGAPGNGKTSLARCLAQRFQLPIYVLSFNSDTDNHSIIRMMSRVRGPALVLIEDFDAYFDGRRPRLENQRFTFDTVLNVLDGLFAPLGPIVVVMTANDLSLVDSALKDRPSRFAFVEEVTAPSEDLRKMILRGLDPSMLKRTEGLTLDQLLRERERELRAASC